MRTYLAILFLTGFSFVLPGEMHAADDTFSCPGISGPTVKISGDQGFEQYRPASWTSGTKFDARGATWQMQWNPTVKSWLPVILGGNWRDAPSPSACFLGGRFEGLNPTSETWCQNYSENAAAISMNASRSVVDGVRVHNAHDGFRVSSRGPVTWLIQNSWFSYNRDDTIENDGKEAGAILDNLFDGVFVLLSSINPDQASGASNTVRVEGNLAWSQNMPGMRISSAVQCNGAGPGRGSLFKYWDSGAPMVELHNNLFMLDPPGDGPSSGLDLGLLRQNKLKSCSGNTLVWLGTGSVPSAEWNEINQRFPGCMRITKDRSVWNAAKQNWINCHPNVPRRSGDPASNPAQCDPNSYGGGGTSNAATTGAGGTTTGSSGVPVIGACNLMRAGDPPPSGYGAAWHVYYPSRGLLLNSNCRESSVELRVGISDASTHYVYKQGYVYRGSWQPFTLTGNFISNSTDWLQGQGGYVLNNPPLGTTFWVGYLCHWDTINLAWHCGCRDQACAAPYWMLQGIVR